MTLRVYNTLTRQKEEFLPLDPPKVKMYVCGITPYDETHLGHARAYATFDIIRRYLEYSGFEVAYVQNITDVDDKIIAKGQGSGVRCREIAEQYTRSYFEVMDRLNVRRADVYPKATEHIPEMVRWISGLMEKGYAYLLDDGVYFEVNKFQNYGKLSGRVKDEQEAGARVKIDARKRSPLDFSLWKKAKEGEPSWPSPWGEGRPGWHIECSVMSTKYLGEQFDLHGGGMDLEFPHHENEIAQTEALTGKVPWVKYWVHNGFVNVNRQKMSKSLGNFFMLKDIFMKYDPMTVRFFLLQTHYRSPIDFSDEQLASAGEALSSLRNLYDNINSMIDENITPGRTPNWNNALQRELIKCKTDFKIAMDDDFNTATAISSIFSLIHAFYQKNKLNDLSQTKECLDEVVKLLDVLGIKVEGTKLSPEIEKLKRERDEARKNKNYTKADEIRRALEKMGYIVKDTKERTVLTNTAYDLSS
jgi:cysteinyl-tRNA synthetase